VAAIFTLVLLKCRHMKSPDPATEAFVRYVRQEIEILTGPIEAGCQHVPGCVGTNGAEIVRATLRSISGYFVRMSGAMTPLTAEFWNGIAEFFQSQLGVFPIGEEDRDYFVNTLAEDQPSQLFGAGAVDLAMLHAIAFYDAENNTAYLARSKMFLWRFAEALVGADLEGTIDEEAALDAFKRVLDAETEHSGGGQA
jgi:hypothetical protein